MKVAIGAPDVGQPFGLHLVDGVALQADPGRRQMTEATDLATAGGEGVFPRFGAVHDRCARALGIRAPGRLAVQLPPPGQEGGVGQIVAARRHLLGHRRHSGRPTGCLRGGKGVGRAQDQGVGPVGQRQHHDELARPGPLEHVGQGHAGLGRPEVADGGQKVGRDGPGGHPEPAGHGLDRPRVQPGHDGVVDVALGDARVS